jgi:DNA-directed RNA polymerase subunit F
MDPKIQEDMPVSIYDVKKELKKIKKRDTELSIRATKTDEYVNQFALLKDKDAEELEKEITDMNIPRLKDMHVKKIVDLYPDSVEELKVILQGYALTISKENMQKIITSVKKYQPEKH